jgi:hypothetical protein
MPPQSSEDRILNRFVVFNFCKKNAPTHRAAAWTAVSVDGVSNITTNGFKPIWSPDRKVL